MLIKFVWNWKYPYNYNQYLHCKLNSTIACRKLTINQLSLTRKHIREWKRNVYETYSRLKMEVAFRSLSCHNNQKLDDFSSGSKYSATFFPLDLTVCLKSSTSQPSCRSINANSFRPKIRFLHLTKTYRHSFSFAVKILISALL